MTERQRFRKMKNDKKLEFYFHNYIEKVVDLEKIEAQSKTDNPPSLWDILNVSDGVNTAIDMLLGIMRHKYGVEEEEARNLIITVCKGITKE